MDLPGVNATSGLRCRAATLKASGTARRHDPSLTQAHALGQGHLPLCSLLPIHTTYIELRARPPFPSFFTHRRARRYVESRSRLPEHSSLTAALAVALVRVLFSPAHRPFPPRFYPYVLNLDIYRVLYLD